jgi:hypothetical protein
MVCVDPHQVPRPGQAEHGFGEGFVGFDVGGVQRGDVDSVAALAAAVPVRDLVVEDWKQDGRAVSITVVLPGCGRAARYGFTGCRSGQLGLWAAECGRADGIRAGS